MPRLMILLILGMAIPANAAQPCCSITGLDTRNGVAMARVTATGQTFNVKGDKLKTLKPGSPVYADFTKILACEGVSVRKARFPRL